MRLSSEQTEAISFSELISSSRSQRKKNILQTFKKVCWKSISLTDTSQYSLNLGNCVVVIVQNVAWYV